VLWIP